MVVQIVDKKDLTVKLQEAGNKLVVIDFYATWCGPCKIIAPKVEELEKQLTNVVFLKVDVDENEDIAQEYDISAMPTFVFIKNNNKLDSFSGASFDKLKDTVERLKYGQFPKKETHAQAHSHAHGQDKKSKSSLPCFLSCFGRKHLDN